MTRVLTLAHLSYPYIEHPLDGGDVSGLIWLLGQHGRRGAAGVGSKAEEENELGTWEAAF